MAGHLVSNAVKYLKAGSTVTLSFGAAPSVAEARITASQRWALSERKTLLQALARTSAPEAAVRLRV